MQQVQRRCFDETSECSAVLYHSPATLIILGFLSQLHMLRSCARQHERGHGCRCATRSGIECSWKSSQLLVDGSLPLLAQVVLAASTMILSIECGPSIVE
ncbi:unnamed protein product, partial [Mycena citricolor]